MCHRRDLGPQLYNSKVNRIRGENSIFTFSHLSFHSQPDPSGTGTMASSGDGPGDVSSDWAGTSLIDLTSPELAKASASVMDSGEDFEVLDDEEEEDMPGLPPLEDVPTSKTTATIDEAPGSMSERPAEEGSEAVEEWVDVLGKELFVFGPGRCFQQQWGRQEFSWCRGGGM